MEALMYQCSRAGLGWPATIRQESRIGRLSPPSGERHDAASQNHARKCLIFMPDIHVWHPSGVTRARLQDGNKSAST
ncbi:MAG: hypothetical protein AUJ57_01920 [Zetaproteobacteria bacterium CG1_02_53_45]|nr:MAG: hypothetical protein AUJ57_01920 [Zetaproteobacteria bacterium CG1_02_53_45]